MTPLTIDTTNNQHAQAATILQQAVCLTLTCHYLGNHRKVELDELVGDKKVDDVEFEAFNATKKLIDSREITPVFRAFGKAKKMLRKYAIPAHRIFGERSYLIPTALVRTVHDELKAYRDMVKAEAKALAFNRYAGAVIKQQSKLGKQFNPNDYLNPADVAASFSLEWSYVSFEAPDNLRTVDAALAEEADAKHLVQLAQAYDEVILSLRTSALGILTDLAERLKPGSPDKPKILRGMALRDLTDFMATLPKRNLAGDNQLVDALAKVSKRAMGLEVSDLKDNAGLRAELQAVAEEAKETLAGLVSEGRRAISFSGALAS